MRGIGDRGTAGTLSLAAVTGGDPPYPPRQGRRPSWAGCEARRVREHVRCHGPPENLADLAAWARDLRRRYAELAWINDAGASGMLIDWLDALSGPRGRSPDRTGAGDQATRTV